VGRRSPPDSAQLIAEPDALTRLVQRLAQEPRVALDTEAASFHRYIDRVYLIQLSSDRETALIDPLSLEDLSPLAQLLDEPRTEIVLHDADYDLRILNRDYGFTARSLFDTRIAAQLAGEPAVGLSALLEKYFGIKLNKKFQRADWSRRPLTSDMIEYAAADTRHLPALRDELESRLKQHGRLDWAKEEFRILEGIRWMQPCDTAAAYLRIKGAKSLSRRSLAVLRELFQWRESTARDLDRAPFRVLGNAALLAIAQLAPRSLNRLKSVDGVPRSAVARYGTELVEAVKRGTEVPQSELPAIKRPLRPEHNQAYDRRLEALKRLRNRRAKEVGMEPGMLCPNGTLQAVARAASSGGKQLSSIAELRKWQANVLGTDEILAAIQG
jgi:ribonuclease D